MYASEAKQLQKHLDDVQDILILSPDHPDLDSVGSNLALAQSLIAQGKSVRLLSNERLKESYSWMEWTDRYMTAEDLPAIRRDKPDLVMITDAAGRGMFDSIIAEDAWLLDDTPVILIDHHATQPDYPTVFSILAPEAAATGQLLCELYQALDWEITPSIANFLLAGIDFDTNGFTNSNVTARLFAASAHLMEHGGDFYTVTQAILSSRAQDETKFKTIAKLQQSVIVDAPVAYLMVPFADISHLKKNTSLVKPLVESIRFLKDVRAAFVLVERVDGQRILSLRSQPGVNVAAVAEHFGGGGHQVAASAVISGEGSLAEAATLVLKQLEKQL